MGGIVLAQFNEFKVFQIDSIFVDHLFQKPAIQRKWLSVSLYFNCLDVLLVVDVDLVEEFEFFEVDFREVFHEVSHWNVRVQELAVLWEQKRLHVVVELVYLQL
jgi:hypothetical protein